MPLAPPRAILKPPGPNESSRKSPKAKRQINHKYPAPGSLMELAAEPTKHLVIRPTIKKASRQIEIPTKRE